MKLTKEVISELRTNGSRKLINIFRRKLEEHKFCNEYHKIKSKDNPKEYFKESCLFVIWCELDELEKMMGEKE